jgi:hypothetical protein
VSKPRRIRYVPKAMRNLPEDQQVAFTLRRLPRPARRRVARTFARTVAAIKTVVRRTGGQPMAHGTRAEDLEAAAQRVTAEDLANIAPFVHEVLAEGLVSWQGPPGFREPTHDETGSITAEALEAMPLRLALELHGAILDANDRAALLGNGNES